MQGVSLNFAQKTCVGRVGKLMRAAGMLTLGARVGVAVSGGVDSFVLLQTLILRKRIVPFPFEIMALHVNPGFDPASHAPLTDWLKERGVSGHIEVTDHGLKAHSEINRKRSACFYCAMLRRTRLFELCKEYGLTHLAFGHNHDDLADTFFMNMLQTGRVEGLRASEGFFGGRLQVIRPMLFVDKPAIISAGRAWGLPIWSNPCPSAGKTKRSEVHDWLATRWKADKRVRVNLFRALERYQAERENISFD